ncbi:hypothetical protein D9611_004386 [Ephemerocybe angulata]|uniref:XRRM domain-containing protein n=1 Tax=Ephemerocybe angulata TaxID=980116 RepID=A0A8H5BK86_9AGAR|nr:hypothetical protein D9611_004386 [Tulosesus angulatus]
MSLAFVPRKLAKKTATGSKAAALPEAKPAVSAPAADTSAKGKEKAPAGPSAEECATLFCLALSDYALWADSDLRMKLSGSSEEATYISLNYLLHHSSVLQPLLGIPQTLLVKHLRTHLSDVLDFRMLVATPQPWFNRSGATSSQTTGGGYEVRLKTWDPASSPIYSKLDWEKRAVYVENVPIHYRSIPMLVKFLVALLPAKDESTPFHERTSRIQHIFLPPHYQDKPGDLPHFKGFAVVTFLQEIDAQHVLESWPWETQGTSSFSTSSSTANSKLLSDNSSEALKEAAKFGFRSTSKSNWEALRAEYLLYRQQLIEEINAHQDNSLPEPSHGQAGGLAPKAPSAETAPVLKRPLKAEAGMNNMRHSPPQEGPTNSKESDITLDSPYPYGCLVFIKNIHYETNKTTLKTLFGKALSGESERLKGGGIDYVDFNKGMDTCYLRLSTPECASVLSSHFDSTPTVQATGLDDTGTPSSGGKDMKPIHVEVVMGTREEVYWQKVPEKIRRGAVEKAVQLQSGRGGSSSKPSVGDDTKEEGRSKKRRRK